MGWPYDNKSAQRIKNIYFQIGLWDPQAMILMGPTALEMGPMIDVLCIRNIKMGPQDAHSL